MQEQTYTAFSLPLCTESLSILNWKLMPDNLPFQIEKCAVHVQKADDFAKL